jgi:hypothetical protein
MGLLGVARANTAVGVSPERFLLLLQWIFGLKKVIRDGLHRVLEAINLCRSSGSAPCQLQSVVVGKFQDLHQPRCWSLLLLSRVRAQPHLGCVLLELPCLPLHDLQLCPAVQLVCVKNSMIVTWWGSAHEQPERM